MENYFKKQRDKMYEQIKLYVKSAIKNAEFEQDKFNDLINGINEAEDFIENFATESLEDQWAMFKHVLQRLKVYN